MNNNYDTYIDTGSGYSLIPKKAVKKIQPANITREGDEMYSRLVIGEVTFQNTSDYKIYDIIDNLSFEVEMKVKVAFGSLEVEGYFAKIDCKFDDDKNGKIVTVTPAINDKYRRYLENYEKEINVTSVEWTYESASAIIPSSTLKIISEWQKESTGLNYKYGQKQLKEKEWDEINSPAEIDFIGFFEAGTNKPNISILSTPPYNAQDASGLDLQSLIDVMGSQNQGWELCEVTIWRGGSWYRPFTTRRLFYVTCKFAREFIFLPTSDGTETGDKVEPVGDGWITQSESPVFDRSSRRINATGLWGYSFYRAPFGGEYKNTWDLQNVVENNGSGGTSFYWTHARTTKIVYPVNEEGDEAAFTINALVDFKSMLTYMYQQLHPDLAAKEVKSLFFWNDDEGDFPFMNGLTGSNYVTRERNELNSLKWFHTYSLKVDNEENGDTEDSELSLSFKDVIEDLQILFPIKIYIDSSLNLWIEHAKFFEIQQSVFDISSKKEIQLTNQFSYDSSKLFPEKTIKQLNAGYVDFTKNTMSFAQSVSNKRNKDNRMEVTTKIFTTDLKYCLENPGSLENGLVFIIAENGEIVGSSGFISYNEQPNGLLSLSRILRRYWTYEGVWTSGQINGIDVNFENAYRSKVGIELQFRGIENSLFYKTQIGIGLIDNGSIDIENEITKVKLRYRYFSGGIGDQKFLAWGDNEGDIFNIGNYE